MPCTIKITPATGLTVNTFMGMEIMEHSWEELEDRIFITLDGRLQFLGLFRDLYKDGVQSASLLESIAYLSTSRKRSMNNDEACAYSEHISAVAYYLSVGKAKKELKVAVLRTIVACLLSADEQWQFCDTVAEGALDFVTQGSSNDWDYMDHSEMMLIWELRAMSLRLLNRKQERIIFLAKTADTAAGVISVGAKLVEEGVSRSGAVLLSRIEYAGVQVKDYIPANEHPILIDRDAVVILTFSNAIKGASVGAKESTKAGVESIRGALAKGVQAISTKVDEDMIGSSLSAEGCEALRAAGKVSVATIGAVAVIGEALFEASRIIVEKTVSVTADVVEHRYGTSAGKVAGNAGETAVNIVRAIGNVSLVSGGATALIKIAAKENAKLQIDADAQKAREALKTIEEQAKLILKTAIGYDDFTLRPKPVVFRAR